MRPSAALLLLIVAFPALYVSGALARSDVASALALALVACVCALLLRGRE